MQFYGDHCSVHEDTESQANMSQVKELHLKDWGPGFDDRLTLEPVHFLIVLILFSEEELEIQTGNDSYQS